MSDATAVGTEVGRETRPADVRVWDPLVRIFHWTLVGGFLVAYVSGDEWDRLHINIGYGIAALIAVRLVWGVVGTRHARFSDFVYRPSRVLAYLRDTMAFRARRYIGHNPAGGAMVVALLTMIAIICGTGYMMTTNAYWGVEWVEEAHEIAVNATLVLIVAHVAGVLVASWEHGENLVRAMVTGRKRAE
ncbi:cytochrome b/b6 domain-containing protein [Microbaculum sp. FT89]|uniref:cytochrome b/b6 domain-containing protein n=1 Tax=Microbaculum sp. FT89 TaxID=3447298 RepID=UPI003F52CA7E